MALADNTAAFVALASFGALVAFVASASFVAYSHMAFDASYDDVQMAVAYTFALASVLVTTAHKQGKAFDAS